MAAPLSSYVRLPNDGNNLGSPSRVVGRLVGGDYVYQHAYAYTSQSKINGLYYFCTAAAAVTQAGQDGITSAYAWIQNPSANVNMRLRKLDIRFTNATATAITHDTAPRIAVALGTFTGAFNGATLTLAKRKTSDSANAGDIRTASTGATVTVGNHVWAALCPGSDFSVAGVYNVSYRSCIDSGDDDATSEDEFIVIAQNECIIIYQMDAGTVNDQRLVSVSGFFDEVDVT